MRSKIFDCITFFNENFITNIRFEILNEFVDHFVIDSIEYYGNLSLEIKETLSAFGLPVNYNPNIAGFSRN